MLDSLQSLHLQLVTGSGWGSQYSSQSMLCRSSQRYRAALAIATPRITSAGPDSGPAQQRRTASRGTGPSTPLVRAGIFGKEAVKELVSDKRRRPDVEQKGQKPAERTAERSNPTRRGRSSQTLGAGSSSRKGGPVASVLQGKGKGRDGTSGAVRPRSSPRSRVSEPPVPIPDLSALPHISKARRVRVPGFDTILLEKPRSADSVSRSSLLDWTLRLPSPPYTANDSQSSTAPSSPFVHVRPTSFPLLQRLPSPRLWLRPGVGS
jgi:hypothetical protein